MAAEATYLRGPATVNFVTSAARTSGEVVQLPDGRAGVITGLKGFASGEVAAAQVEGVFTVLKTASIALLKGGKLYWDRSAGKAHFRPQSGDFYVGTVHADAAAAATTVEVALNVEQRNVLELTKRGSDALWTKEATDGLGVTEGDFDSPITLAFDAVAEVAQAALFPTDTTEHVPVTVPAIHELRLAIFDIGDNAALDITFGIANGSHATDFDAVTEACVFHLDGTALSILAESDDGTTEVAATDTTVDAVDDTYLEVWIDARDLSDIQLYIDGVNVLPASVFKLNAATGPLFPIAHLEKTSNDTPADLRVDFIRTRTMDVAA